jgi:hypothetical protein
MNVSYNFDDYALLKELHIPKDDNFQFVEQTDFYSILLLVCPIWLPLFIFCSIVCV